MCWVGFERLGELGVDAVMAQTEPYRAVGVLVVDDEPMLRIYALDFIEDAGFAAYEASGPDEAIRMLESHPDICIVFTDINMPGSMDGLKLARYVRRRWPPVQIIVTSGQMEPGSEEMPTGSVFLSKPYRPEMITGRLRKMAESVARGMPGDQGNRL
jgi:two-component system, response regulator PdtaR